MPDLSVSRQELLMKQSFRQAKVKGHGLVVIGGVEFNHNSQKLSVANNLFQTVIKGNINKVRHLLARGAGINTKNDYGFSPLVAALHIEDPQKRWKMFQLLLERGALPNVKDSNKGRPVLHWACILGQIEQVTGLLEETAGDIDLNEKDDEGYTALHHAVKIGSTPIVEKLVEFHVRFGVSVDAVDKLGLTPYLHARRLGYRDVAAVLKEQGLASLGHGDNLFRSPREWSQIGKFERKKAIHLDHLGKINEAKIMGKPMLCTLMENSPRMAIPGIVVPSYRPDKIEELKRKPPHHLSNSLPSLSQAEPVEKNERPSTATKSKKPDVTNHDGRPGPPTVAFADDQGIDSKSSFKSNISGQQFSTHNNNIPINTNNSVATSNVNSTMTINNNYNQNQEQGILKVKSGTVQVSNDHVTSQTSIFPGHSRSASNLAALDLLQHTTRGRLVNQFHHSQFDKSKTSEYKQMLGNLNSIMDILSQQQTKSFRKSVEVKKPETPPKIKKKSKVSTLAIIFGHNGRKRSGSRKKKSRSPSNENKANKTKTKSGKSPSSGKQTSREKAKETSQKKVIEQPNKLPVPTIKIN